MDLTGPHPLISENTEEAIKKARNCMACDEPNCKTKCSRCYTVHYCGKTCQQQHWKTHKPICKIFCNIVEAFKMYSGEFGGGYNLTGSLAMYLRLKRLGIPSDIVLGYAVNPNNQNFVHIWIEVEKRIFDFSIQVNEELKQKHLEYRTTPKEGAYRADLNEHANIKEELMSGVRELKYDINGFRKTWITKSMRNCGFLGLNMMVAFFTPEVLEEVTGKTLAELRGEQMKHMFRFAEVPHHMAQELGFAPQPLQGFK